MKTFSRIIILLFSLSFLVSCASLQPDTLDLSQSPGYLLTKSATDLETTLSWASVDFLASRLNTKSLVNTGYDAWRESKRGTLRDVQVFKVQFDTLLVPQGLPDRQSGVVLVPAAKKGQQQALTWIIWTRGTELDRAMAPSNYAGNEILFPTLLASMGFAVWMPDYAGFGTSTGLQTYCVPQSQALSALDGLQAARQLVANLGEYYQETGRLKLFGYSQGGQAAMATAQAWAANPGQTPGLKLKEVSALAAPFDLMIGVDASFDKQQIVARPEYNVYVVLGWAKAYPDIVKVAEILNPVVIEKIVPLFTNIHDAGQLHQHIAQALGKAKGQVRYADLFRADYLQAVTTNPETVAYYRLQKAARLDRWLPPVGMRLNLGTTLADQVVNPANSVSARDYILQNNPKADMVFTEFYSTDHASAAAEAILLELVKLDRAEGSN